MSILTIISGALMFSVLQMAVIGHVFFGPLPDATAPSINELLQTPAILALMGFCVFALVISFVLPKLLLKTALKNLPQKTSFSLEKELVAKFVVSHIVRLAILESIAVCGLIMTLLTHNTSLVLGCSALSLAVMGLFFPTKSKVENLIQDSSYQKIRIS